MAVVVAKITLPYTTPSHKGDVMRLFRAWESFWGYLGFLRRNRRQRKAALARRRDLRRRHRMDALEQRVVLNADAVDDSLTTDYGTFADVSVLSNDEGIDLTVTGVGTPINGSVQDQGGGVLRYTPNAGFSGSDSFSYTIQGEDFTIDTATVSVTVGSPPPTNNAPWANNYTYEYEIPYGAGWDYYDVSGYQPPSSEYGDPEDGSATIIANDNPGTVYVAAGQSLSYAYTVRDSGYLTATGTITINFVEGAPPTPTNNSPWANDATFELQVPYGSGGGYYDLSGYVPQEGTHYDDPDSGDSLTLSYSGYGYTSVAPGQQYSYSYSVDDGHGGTASATVYINIVEDSLPPTNSGPTANMDDLGDLNPGQTVTGNLFANDTDPENDTLRTDAYDGSVSGGHLTLETNGNYTLVIDGSLGSGSYEYTIYDAVNNTASASLVWNIVDPPPTNHAPWADAGDFTIDVTHNDSGRYIGIDEGLYGDPDGDSLNLTYDSVYVEPGSSGSVSYTVTDPFGASNTNTVSLTLNVLANSAPVAQDDQVTTDEDAPTTFDVRNNDSDFDGDGMTVSIPATLSDGTPNGPTNGTAIVNGDGTITYAPNADFYGTDSFTCRLDDGWGGITTSVVTVTVNSVNDAPTLSAPTAQQVTTTGDTLVFSVAGGNALEVGDVEDGTKRMTLAVDHGQLSYGAGVPAQSLIISGTVAQLNAALGGLRFHALANYAGPAALTITVDDQDAEGGGPLTAAATVALRVQPTISIADAVASEAAGSLTFTVTLSALCDQDVTVTWRTQPETADAADFTSASGLLTIAAGQTTGTITVALTNDDRDEDDQTFQLLLSNPENGVLADAVATGTIQDDESAPLVYVVSREVREGDGTVQVLVRLSHPSEKPIQVEWHPYDGSAIRGTDGNSYDWTQGSWTPPYSQQEYLDQGGYQDVWVENTGWYPVWIPDQYGDVWVDTSHYGDVWVPSGYWNYNVWIDTSHYGDVWVDTSHWGDVWVPNLVNEPIQIDDQLDEYGNVVTPGYWQENWVDHGSYQYQLINEGHNEWQWITEGHLGDQWIDTSHYEPQWIVEGHYENVVTIPAHNETQWLTVGSYQQQWVSNWQWTYVGYSGYWTDGDMLDFAPGVTEQAAEVTILDDTEAEGDESFTIQLSNPSNGVLDSVSYGDVTIRSSDHPVTVMGNSITASLYVNDTWSWTKDELLTAVGANDPDGEAIAVGLPFGSSVFGVLVDDGDGAFSYHAADQSGTDSISIILTDGDGFTQYVTLNVFVSSNVAPVLNSEAVGTLIAVNEDVDDANNPGTLVADLLADSVSDANDEQFGVAIVAATALGGTWQYRRTVGSGWTDFAPDLSDDSALLLYADATTRVRFIPATDYYHVEGEPDPTLTFRAWDRSNDVAGALNGTIANVSITDGSSPFSAISADAAVIVNAVNDAPTFTAGENVTVLRDSDAYSEAWAGTISAGPLEASQGLSWSISVDHPELFDDGPTIDADGQLHFRPAAGVSGTALVAVTLIDDGGTARGGHDRSVPTSFTITLLALPTVSASDVSTSEGNGTLTFTVTLSQASDSAVTVDWTLVDGTAQRPTDYGYAWQVVEPAHDEIRDGFNVVKHTPVYEAEYANNEFQVGVGEAIDHYHVTQQQDSVDPSLINDVDFDSAGPTVDSSWVTYTAVMRTIFSTIHAGTLTNVGQVSSAWDNGGYPTGTTVRVRIDDTQEPHIDGNDPGWPTQDNNDDQPWYTFTPAPRTVRVEARYDWVQVGELSGTLTFAARATSQTVTVYVHNDNVLESDETLQLQLSNPQGATIAGNGAATGTILNDDAPTQNHAPTAGSDSYTVTEDGVLSVAADVTNALAANDADADGDTLLYSLVGSAPNGLTLNSDGSFTYIPPADYVGTTTFDYRVSDGRGGTCTATVTITVTAVPDAPVAHVPASYSATDASTLALHASGLSLTDVDADQNATMELTLAVVHGRLSASVGTTGATVSGSGGSSILLSGTITQLNTLLSGGNGGSLTYEYSDDEAPLTDTLSLTVVDHGGATALTAQAVTSIYVLHDPTRPMITSIANVVIDEDGCSDPITFTIGDDVTPPEELVVTATSEDVTLIPSANLVVTGSGAERSLVITPAANLNGGPVMITLTVSDGQRTAYRTFAVTVAPVNDAPTFTLRDDLSVPVDAGPVEIESALANVSVGPVNEALQTYTVTVTADVPELFAPDGQPAIVMDEHGIGKLTFTPQFSGVAVITVKVKDTGGGGDTTTKTFVLEVTEPGTAAVGGGTGAIGSGGAVQPQNPVVDAWAISDIKVIVTNKDDKTFDLKNGDVPHVPVDAALKVEVNLADGVPPGAKVKLTWGTDLFSNSDPITETRNAASTVTFTKDFSDPSDERLPSQRLVIRVESASGELLEKRLVNLILDWPDVSVTVDDDTKVNIDDEEAETIELTFNDIPEKLRHGSPIIGFKSSGGYGWPYYPNTPGDDPNFDRESGVFKYSAYPREPGKYTLFAQYGHAYTEFDVTVTRSPIEGDITISVGAPLWEGSEGNVNILIDGDVDPETEFTVTIDWGDGTTKTYKVTGDDTFGFGHTYVDGTRLYNVRVDVTGGNMTKSETGTINVDNVAPTFSSSADPNSACEAVVTGVQTVDSHVQDGTDEFGNPIQWTTYTVEVIYEGYVFDPGLADGLFGEFAGLAVEGSVNIDKIDDYGNWKFTAVAQLDLDYPVTSLDDFQENMLPGLAVYDGETYCVTQHFLRVYALGGHDDDSDSNRVVDVAATILDSVAGEPIKLPDGTEVEEGAVVRFTRTVVVPGDNDKVSDWVQVGENGPKQGDGNTTGTTTINYHFVPVNDSIGATSADWGGSRTVTIEAGESYVDEVLIPVDDDQAEWNEKFKLVIDGWTHRARDQHDPVEVGVITVLDNDVDAQLGSTNVDTAVTGLTREYVEDVYGNLVSLYDGSSIWVVPFGDGELGALYRSGGVGSDWTVNTVHLPGTTSPSGGLDASAGTPRDLAFVSGDEAVVNGLGDDLTLRRAYGGVADVTASAAFATTNPNPAVDNARFGFVDRLIPVETSGVGNTTPLLGFILLRGDGTSAWYSAAPGDAAKTATAQVEDDVISWSLTGLNTDRFYQVTLPQGDPRYALFGNDLHLVKGNFVSYGRLSGQTDYGASVGFILPDKDGKIEFVYTGRENIGSPTLSAFDRWTFITPDGSRSPDGESLATLASAGSDAGVSDPRLTLTTKFGDNYSFNGLGLLVADSDRLGNRSEYTYESATPENPGMERRLSQIKRQGGVTLDFKYASDEGTQLASIAQYVGSDAANNPTRRVTLVSEGTLISATPNDPTRSLAIHVQPFYSDTSSEPHLQDIQITAWTLGVFFGSLNDHDAAPTGNISSTSTDEAVASFRRAYYDQSSVEATPKAWTYQFDRFGLVTAKAAPKGADDPQRQVWTWERDEESGYVTKFSAPAGQGDTSDTDIQPPSSGTIDTEYYYDVHGNLQYVVYADGSHEEFEFDSDKHNQLHAYTDQYGRTTTYNLNADGTVESLEDPTSATVHYTYLGGSTTVAGRPNGLIDVITDELNNKTKYEYYGASDGAKNGLVKKITYAYQSSSERFETLDYDALGNLQSKVDVDGVTHHYQYDKLGQLLEERVGGTVNGTTGNLSGGLLVAKYTYDGRGNLRTSTELSPKDNVFVNNVYDYDVVGRLQKTTQTGSGDSGKVVTEYLYYGDGLVRQITDPAQRQTAYVYDDRRQLIETQQTLDGVATSGGGTYSGLQTVAEYHYDVAGNLQSQNGTSPLDVTTYTYDLRGRVLRQKLPDVDGPADTNGLGGDDLPQLYVQYGYDEHGNVAQSLPRTKDELTSAPVSRTFYDAAGRVLRVEGPAVTQTVDNQTVVTATFTSYEYWADGSVKTVREGFAKSPSGSTPSANGLRNDDETRLTTQIWYDAFGRVTAQKVSGVGVPEANTTYAYPLAGDATPPVADGAAVRYEVVTEPPIDGFARITWNYFDQYDRLIRTVNPDPDGSGSLKALSDVYRYNSDGTVAKSWQEIGTDTTPVREVTYQYDVLGRLIRKDDALGLLAGYKYDVLGQVEVEYLPGGKQIAYEYDALGRVASKQYVGAAGLAPETFAYDVDGNLLDYVSPYGDHTTYKYDGLGQLRDSTEADYSFVGAGKTGVGHQAGDKVTRAYFDEQGRVYARRIQKSGNTVAVTLYDSLDELGRPGEIVVDGNYSAYAYDAAGNVIRQTTRLTGDLNAVDSKAAYEYDGLNRKTVDRIFPNGSAEEQRWQYDVSGLLKQYTDRDGRKTIYSYDALGRQTKIEYQNSDGASQGWAEFAYYSDGNLKSAKSFDANSALVSDIEYENYDVRGRARKITETVSAFETSETVVFNYAFNDTLGSSQRKIATAVSGYTVSATSLSGATAYYTNTYQFDAAGREVYAYQNVDGVDNDKMVTRQYFLSGSDGEVAWVAPRRDLLTRYGVDEGDDSPTQLQKLFQSVTFYEKEDSHLVQSVKHLKPDGTPLEEFNRGIVAGDIEFVSYDERYDYDVADRVRKYENYDETKYPPLVPTRPETAVTYDRLTTLNNGKAYNVEYDREGRITKFDEADTMSMTWNAAGQLTRVYADGGVNDDDADFAYDAFGRLVASKSEIEGLRVLFREGGQEVLRFTGDGTLELRQFRSAGTGEIYAVDRPNGQYDRTVQWAINDKNGITSVWATRQFSLDTAADGGYIFQVEPRGGNFNVASVGVTYDGGQWTSDILGGRALSTPDAMATQPYGGLPEKLGFFDKYVARPLQAAGGAIQVGFGIAAIYGTFGLGTAVGVAAIASGADDIHSAITGRESMKGQAGRTVARELGGSQATQDLAAFGAEFAGGLIGGGGAAAKTVGTAGKAAKAARLAAKSDDVARLGGKLDDAGRIAGKFDAPRLPETSYMKWDDQLKQFVTQGGCFTPETLVHLAATASGHDLQRGGVSCAVTSIASVRLGSRVVGENPDPKEVDLGFGPPEEATWVRIVAQVRRADGSQVEIEMLRPRDWAEANRIVAGTRLEVRRAELQLAATATIESVGPCPPIAAGDGHVVIGRFITRDVLNLVRVRLVDGTTIDVTDAHLFWSVDRHDWVAAGELQPGERLDGNDGVATVADVQPLGHAPAVYNLEVHGQHVYRVAALGVLVHNTTDAACKPGIAAPVTKGPAWKQYEQRFGGQQTPMTTTFQGKTVKVRLDTPPSDSTIVDFKHYNWSNSSYQKRFIQQRVTNDFAEQIGKYKTIRPNVHLQFSQEPPAWAVQAIQNAGGTFSVVL